jgi:hypothetical protein
MQKDLSGLINIEEAISRPSGSAVDCLLDDYLQVDNRSNARDLKYIYDNEFAAVVDLALDEPPAQLGRDIMYFRVPIVDGAGNSRASIETAILCVSTLLKNSQKTMVACSHGMSRSPVIAAAGMSLFLNEDPDICLSAVSKQRRLDVSPDLWLLTKDILAELKRPRV